MHVADENRSKDDVRVASKVRIPLLENGKQADFVEYELVISSGDEESSVWFTWKQLNELDNTLKKRFKKDEFPPFPGRAFFRNETEYEFIETRRIGLEAYLRQVVPRYLGNCDELDAFLAAAELRFEFVVPSKLNHAPTVFVRGEEVWIGLVCDGLFEGLSYLVQLKFKLTHLTGLDEQLGLLELNHTRTMAIIETMSANLAALTPVIEVEGLPKETRTYFENLEKQSKIAMGWTKRVEVSLLSSLDGVHSFAPTVGAPLAPVSPPRNNAKQTDDEEEEYERIGPASVVSPVTAAVAAKDAPCSVAEYLERADDLCLKMIAFESVPEQAKLLQNKKDLIEQMMRARDRNEQSEAAWTRAIEHVQEFVVVSASIHDLVMRLEGQLYELIGRRGALSANSDRRESSSVRRSVISLRRLLRQVKETHFGGNVEDDPALMADCNRLTDIQENAAQLQIDLESTFEFDSNMEDFVVDKLKQRVMETAAKEHEQADSDLFEL